MRATTHHRPAAPATSTIVLLSLVAALPLHGCSSDSPDAPLAMAPPPAAVDADGDGTTSTADCNDADAGIWRTADVYLDADRDGVGAGAKESACIGQTPPAGLSFSADDCAADDLARFLTLSYAAMDSDRDGYVRIDSGTLCTGGTLPIPYFAVLAADAQIDCDDTTHTLWRVVTVYRDVDGDAVGSGRGTPTCVGASPDSGYSFLGYDPLDVAGDPTSALVSNFDINPALLTVDSDGEEDDVFP